MKRVGLLLGLETALGEALAERLAARGVAAEPVSVGGVPERVVSRYDAILDRVGPFVPYYQAYLRGAVAAGVNVVNDPFWSTGADRFSDLSLLGSAGVRVPRAALLPQRAYAPPVDPARWLGNLEYPLRWDAILDYVGLPAVLRRVDGVGLSPAIPVRERRDLVPRYDAQAGVLMLQHAPSAPVVEVLCVGAERRVLADRTPSLRSAIDALAARAHAALGYDINTLSVTVDEDGPIVVDTARGYPALGGDALPADEAHWAAEALAELLVARAPRAAVGSRSDTGSAPEPAHRRGNVATTPLSLAFRLRQNSPMKVCARGLRRPPPRPYAREHGMSNASQDRRSSSRKTDLLRGAVGLIATSALLAGCPATQFFNEGPGQPTDRASGLAPAGSVGACKLRYSTRPPLVDRQLWENLKFCNKNTPYRYLRLGVGRNETGPDVEAMARVERILKSVQQAEEQDDGNVRMLGMLRAVRSEARDNPALMSRVERSGSRPYACDYRYLLNTMEMQRQKLAKGDACPVYVYDPTLRRDACLFDTSVGGTSWLTSAWGCMAFTGTLGEGESCYRLCSFDEYCGAQVNCGAPDFDLVLCSMGVCLPEKVVGLY